MKRLAATLTLICLSAPAMAQLAATAQAAPFPPRLNFAYSLAIGYWGQAPTACATIDKRVVPPGALAKPGSGFAPSGEASMPPPNAPSGSVDCVLWIDRAYAEPIIFDLLCAVMVHEVGHLLGMEHSEDPADVMNERIPVPKLCDVKGRQATRLYMLRMKLHRLQKQHGVGAVRMRLQTHREVTQEAQRFWGPAS